MKVARAAVTAAATNAATPTDRVSLSRVARGRGYRFRVGSGGNQPGDSDAGPCGRPENRKTVLL
jgi:hypothetical protein